MEPRQWSKKLRGGREIEIFQFHGVLLARGWLYFFNIPDFSGINVDHHPHGITPGTCRNLVNFHHLGAGQNASVAVMSISEAFLTRLGVDTVDHWGWERKARC